MMKVQLFKILRDFFHFGMRHLDQLTSVVNGLNTRATALQARLKASVTLESIIGGSSPRLTTVNPRNHLTR